MFNPNNLDEVSVQATHLEARGTNISEEGSKKKPFKGKGKEKGGKWKGKKNASVKKEGEKTTCKHCSKEGNDEAHCWKFHPVLWPKKPKNKGKTNMTASTQHDLQSDSDDETKIVAMVKKGKESISCNSSSNCHKNTPNEDTRI